MKDSKCVKQFWKDALSLGILPLMSQTIIKGLFLAVYNKDSYCTLTICPIVLQRRGIKNKSALKCYLLLVQVYLPVLSVKT